jgi:outer membrane protein assembly factor BamB
MDVGIGVSVGSVVERDDLATVISTFTQANAAAVRRILNDGVNIVIVYSTWVECFNHDTGAQNWIYNHTAAVYDICMDGTNVYIGGVAGVGAHEVIALSLSTGATVWSYQHNGTVNAIATNGRQVFISGVASGHGSAATVRAIDAADGFDAANEGGTGLSATALAWDSTLANNPASAGRLQTDGKLLFLSMSAGANTLRSYSCGDFTQISLGNTAYASGLISVDGEYVYRIEAGIPGEIHAYDKQNLAFTWNLPITIGGTFYNWLCSDGAKLFTAPSVGTAFELQSHYKANKPRLWRRVDTTDDHLPYRQLAIPEER